MSKMSEQLEFMEAQAPSALPPQQAAPAPVAAPAQVEMNLPVPINTPLIPTSVSYLPVGEEAQMLSQWATMVAASPYYQKAGGKAGILSMWLCAKELGIPPMQALNGGLYYVQGQVTMSSRMMNTLIRQRGHSVQKIEGTNLVCHLKGTRKDNGDVSESIFTIEMAKNAGLTSKGGPWKTYPERMLFNRALSNLAKDLFADCIGTAYVEGELDHIEDHEETAKPEHSKKSLAFIDKHHLYNKESELYKFIEAISDTIDQNPSRVIADAAKDEVKFLASFENYKNKK